MKLERLKLTKTFFLVNAPFLATGACSNSQQPQQRGAILATPAKQIARPARVTGGDLR